MADEADLANDQAERFLAASLASIPRGPKLEPRGTCHYCEMDFDPVVDAKTGKPTMSPKLFCDKDCADDYEREQRLRRR